LNVIAGIVPGSKIKGELLFNGQPREPWVKYVTGYVHQEDLLFAGLTVEQTLRFTGAFKLQLPHEERERRVEEVISCLNLAKCRRSQVGGGWKRGISGGEKRRASIGNELITNPSLLLLDEPTSGLDAATAEELILTLKNLARQGRTIITTIHQPSSQVFFSFDKVLNRFV